MNAAASPFRTEHRDPRSFVLLALLLLRR